MKQEREQPGSPSASPEASASRARRAGAGKPWTFSRKDLARRIFSSLNPEGALAGIYASGALRIGYSEIRPWSYHFGDRLLGQDVEVAHELARFLGVTPVFVQCGRSELEFGLAQRRLQLAIGGLVEQGYDGIRCIPVRRLANTLDYGCPRVYFPSGWWIRKSEWTWEAMLAAFLAWRRLKARAQAEQAA